MANGFEWEDSGELESTYGESSASLVGEAGVYGEQETEAPFNEIDEVELAAELLSVSNEAELEQFLGSLIRRAGSAVGSFVRSPVGQALGGVLKNAARQALPIVGGAIGSAVGGQTGGRLGQQLATTAGRVFGLELEGLSAEDQEFEAARRFVRFAGAAAGRAAMAPRGASPMQAAQAAARGAAGRYAPGLLRGAGPRGFRARRGRRGFPRRFAGYGGVFGADPVQTQEPDFGDGGDSGLGAPGSAGGDYSAEPAGRWLRRGRQIIVFNCLRQASAKESQMHDLDRTQLESVGAYETDEFNYEDQELPGGTFGEGPFGETEVNELAMELMSVQSEEELDQFLGGLLKKAGRAVGGFIKSPVGKALGGVLKGVAKKALPMVGGALGSLIPIPGVGTAVGSALGKAVSNALETEGIVGEDQEFEMARRFVQIAGTAAQQAASAPPTQSPQATAVRAVRAAVQQATGAAGAAGGMRGAASGRWFRRGRKIVLVGV